MNQIQKDNDPVKKVYFYEKGKPMEAIAGGDVVRQVHFSQLSSLFKIIMHMYARNLMQILEPTVALVCPQKFSVSQWKVYMYSDLKKNEQEIIR